MSQNEKPMIRKGALGKGIGSLLGGSGLGEEEVPRKASMPIESERREGDEALRSAPQKEAVPTASSIRSNLVAQIRVDQIRVNPKQPRKFFDKQKLEELSESIKRDGVLQPLVVVKDESSDTGYMLVAGERRLRASKLAGLTIVPAIVKNVAPQDLLRIALIENIQRADLNVIEEAEALAALIKDLGLTQEQCAQQVGKDRSTIANLLRLLNLPAEVQSDLVEGTMTAGHARALLGLEDQRLMLRARDIILKKGLNVRQTEQLCRKVRKAGILEAPEDVPDNASVDPNLEYLAEKVRSAFRTKVRIVGTPARGRIELSYFNAAELERIIQIIESSSTGA